MSKGFYSIETSSLWSLLHSTRLLLAIELDRANHKSEKLVSLLSSLPKAQRSIVISLLEYAYFFKRSNKLLNFNIYLLKTRLTFIVTIL